MSKKLAESLDSLVLDVKYGSGAFMKTKAEAKSLSSDLKRVGEAEGVQVSAVLSPMSEPLGRAVGNALEVQEAIDTLRGDGPEDLVSLTLDLASEISSVERPQLKIWLEDGTAWNKWVELVEAQGGDSSVLEAYGHVHPADIRRDVEATQNGTVREMDARFIGQASLELGAGRAKSDDKIDYAVGFSNLAKTGEEVEKGDRLATIHARTGSEADQAEEAFRKAARIA